LKVNSTPTSRTGIRTLSAAELGHRLQENDQPLLIYFSAPWCGPCKQVAPILEDLAAEQSSECIVKINIDENAEAAARFSVRNIPTVILFADGKEKARLLGGKPKSVYKALLATSDAEKLEELVNPEGPELFEILRDISLLKKTVAGDPEFVSRRDEYFKLTPLEMAVRNRMEDAARYLIENGALPGPVETMALRSIGTVAEIIKHTPSITAATQVRGTTALHIAAFWGRSDVVQLLLDAGADPNAFEEKAAILDAVLGSNLDTVRVLLEAGASPNPPPNGPSGERGRLMSPLHLAAMIGNREICELLIRHGADAGALRDRMGHKDDGVLTPAGDAVKNGHADIAKYLQQCAGENQNMQESK